MDNVSHVSRAFARGLATVSLGACLLMVLTGCQTTGEDDAEPEVNQRAWNSPASWEGTIIGIPY